ncbi:DMT family transporter [Sneathiella limimaris]|uniref:DMT family transporter n=1 Tax=Sneathiella limimaris TaxID=1964213 RepID=UPI00146D5DE1|nr:DMT family transporter [Sneathiella limimaris]
MTKTTSPLWIELCCLALLALLWGSSYLFLKVAVTELPPVTLIAFRVTGAAVFLLVVIGVRRERLPRDGKTWQMLLIQAFLNSFGAWVLLAWGQQYVDSALTSVLNSTSPIFVFLFTFFITRHESTNLLKLSGAFLGLAGVVMIVGLDALQGLGQQVAGQLAAVGSAALYGCAAIYGKRFGHLSASVTATGTMIWSAVVLIPACLIIDQPWTLTPSLKALGAATALSILCTGCALLLYFRLVKTLGSLGAASQAYLRAGFGVMLGVVFLGETITPVMGIGILAAVIGVAAINFPTRKKKPVPLP